MLLCCLVLGFCWEIHDHLNHCSPYVICHFFLPAFWIFKKSSVLNSFIKIYLGVFFYWVFVELLKSVNLSFSLNLGDFSTIIFFKNFSSISLSSSSGTTTTLKLDLLILTPQLVGTLLTVFQSFVLFVLQIG